MAKERDYQQLIDRLAALRETVAGRQSADLISNPQLADALLKEINTLYAATVSADRAAPPPPDKGLAQLVGVGPEAAQEFGVTRIPQGVEEYDENVLSERVIPWIQERLGISSGLVLSRGRQS